MHKFRIELHERFEGDITLVMFLDGEEVYRGSATWTSTQAGLFRINPLRVIEKYFFEQQKKNKELINLAEYDLEGVELVIVAEKILALQESLATIHHDQKFPRHCSGCNTPLDPKKTMYFGYGDDLWLCLKCDEAGLDSRHHF